MNRPTADPSPSEELLARYADDLEAAPDPAAVRDRYAADRPDLRSDFDHLFRVRAGLGAATGPPPAGPTLLRPGDRLGPFAVVKFVGRGGMGEVYEAVQDGLDRRVALKVSGRELATDPAREQFLREQQVPAQLHQTHVVPVHFAGHDPCRKLWYYAMHFVDGVSLSTALAELFRRETSAPGGRPTLPLDELVCSLVSSAAPDPHDVTRAYLGTATGDATGPGGRVASGVRLRLTGAYFASVARTMGEIAGAVEYLHARGVRHRDIKPSNVMMDRDGSSYLIDFGLAVRTPEADAAPAGGPADRLRPVEPGTPEYMAPEQFAGPGRPPRPVDHRADVYALGVTLYELLTLRPAYRDPERAKLPEQVVAGRAAPVRELVANAPPDLVAICRKAMSPDPADRYPTAAAFAEDLRRWAGWRPTVARPGWRTLRPVRLWAWRNKARAVAAAAVLVLLLGSSAWALQRAEQRRQELERLDRQQRYEKAVLAAQQVTLGPPYSGWAADARARLDEARRIRPDADLRDHAAATLTGLDARPVLRHDLPGWPDLRGLSSVAFSPDGRRIAAGGWVVETREKVHRSPGLLFDGAAPAPAAAAVSGLGPVAFRAADRPLQLVRPTGDRKTLLLWDLAANAKVAEIELPLSGVVTDAALSADARFAAAAVETAPGAGATFLWEFDAGKPGAVRPAGKWDGPATALGFSPDGRYLAAGTDRGEVVVRAVAGGKEVLRLTEGYLRVTAVGFGRNFWAAGGGRPRAAAGGVPGYLLAVGSRGGNLAVWDLETRVRVTAFRGSPYDVFAIAFSPDGATLASAGRDQPFLWDVATARQVLALSAGRPKGYFRNWMTGVAFSPDGRRVALSSGAIDTHVAGLDVFELTDGPAARTYRGLAGPVEKVWVSPGKKWVAALAQNWQVGVWELSTGRLAQVWDVADGWTADNAALAFSDDEADVIFASGRRAARWAIESGQELAHWELPLGLTDNLAVRPGRPPLLVRMERVAEPERGKPRPPTVIVGRELVGGKPAPEAELYRIPDFPDGLNYLTLSADGRVLKAEKGIGTPHPQRAFYDGVTGRPLALPALPGDDVNFPRSANESGTLLVRNRTVGGGIVSDVYRLPALELVATHPGDLGPVDRDGTVGTVNSPDGHGLRLVRVGDPRPILVLEPGRKVRGQHHLTPDGKHLFWGRDDGTVHVADVERCLEEVLPFRGAEK